MKGWRRVVLYSLFLANVPAAWAVDSLLSLGAVGGLPDLLGVDVRVHPYKNFDVGIGFGSLPLNSLLKDQIPLTPIAVDLQQPDNYTILPRVSFQMSAFTPYLRYYPWESAFYLQTSYSIWRFSAAISGDLRNETSQEVASSIVTGSLQITQGVVTPGFGWNWKLGSFYLDLGMGLSILREVVPTSSISSSVSGILNLVPEGQAALDTAQQELKTQVDNGVASYREKIRFLPSLRLGIGIAL